MIEIFHIEKTRILRDAMKRYLQSIPGLRWVGSSEYIDDFLVTLQKGQRVDILVMDTQVCDDCLELLTFLKEKFPVLRVVFNSSYQSSPWLKPYLVFKKIGFVSKHSGLAEMQRAIVEVSKGNLYLCSIMQEDAKIKDVLTRREKEILRLLAKGLSTRLIAARLFVSNKTIESHRSQLTRKTNSRNTPELIQFALRLGYLG